MRKMAILFNKYLLMYFVLMLGKQSTFLQHVNFLTRTMSHMVNPFMDTSGDLLVLELLLTLLWGTPFRNFEKLGQEMCDTFFKKPPG